jgi:hypothetical protein
MLRSLAVIVLLASPAAAQALPPAPQLEDRFGAWAVQCTLDAVALYPTCAVSGGAGVAGDRRQLQLRRAHDDDRRRRDRCLGRAAARGAGRGGARVGRYLECRGGVCADEAAPQSGCLTGR